MELHSRNPGETRDLARVLARAIDAEGLVIALIGPLGAGKTVFAKGLARGLDVDEGLLSSPSFVIANELPTPRGIRLVHADLYRVESEAELESAWTWARSRAGQAPDRQELGRLQAALQRRGFGRDVIREVMERLTRESDEPL